MSAGPGQLSADGRWFWDGGQWRPVPPPPPVGEGLFWFLSQPGFYRTTALLGLLSIVPIVGVAWVYGWLLEQRDRIRVQGRVLHPLEAGRQFGRGLRPMLAYYAVAAVMAVAIVAAVVPVIVGFVEGGHGQMAPLPPAAWAVVAGGGLAAFVVGVHLFFNTTSLLVLADRYGVGHALNPANCWRCTLANVEPWVKVLGSTLLGGLCLVPVAIVGSVAGLVIPFAQQLVMSVFMPIPYMLSAPYFAQFNEEARA